MTPPQPASTAGGTNDRAAMAHRAALYRRLMRHARSDALDELEPLLAEIRRVRGLVERNRGVFYRRSKAFLHFHEDVSGLHADLRVTEGFERFRVQTSAEREQLLTLIRSIADPLPSGTTRY